MPADSAVEEKQEPKIDFTNSGEKKLDLGFGFGTAKPADAQATAKQLSWERMRKAGNNLFPRLLISLATWLEMRHVLIQSFIHLLIL